MKGSLNLIVCLLLSVMLIGCSTIHTIRTKDGQEYTSSEEPDLTDDRFIKFRTMDGRKVLLKQGDVFSVSED